MIYFTPSTKKKAHKMRLKRMILPDETAFYHCVSKTRGQEMLLTDDEKRRLHELMRRVAGFSGVEVKTYCLMDNHFHMLVKVPLRREVDDAELVARMRILYGDAKTDARLATWKLWERKGQAHKIDAAKAALRKRFFNLSDFFKTLKERFAKDFNRRTGSAGVFWSERFRSVILAPEKGILTTVGAYAELNPVRVGVVKKAEKYAFSGLGAASRGDTAALDGIRDLIEPVPRKNRRITTETAFAEYQNIIVAKLPELGRKVGTGTKMGVYKHSKSRPNTFNYIAGAALGSLKFVGKMAVFVLGNALTIQQYAYRPYNQIHNEYYSVKRVNYKRR